MKKLFLAAAIVLSSSSIFAQSGFGIKAGVNFANVELKSEGISISPSSQTSFNLGIFKDITLGETLVFQPALSFSGKGYKFDQSESDEDLGISYSAKESVNIYYLEVPLNLLAKFDAGAGKFFIGAGPYAAFGIFGKHKYDYNFPGMGSLSGNDKIVFGDQYTAEEEESEEAVSKVKRADFGLNFLAGYQLSSGLSLNAGYGLGLTNIEPKDSEGNNAQTTKNKVFSISIGFSF